MTRRVIVTGSRDWPHPDAVWAGLDAELALVPAGGRLVVVHGACPSGADLEADRWATARRAETGRDVVVERHPAQWERHRQPKGSNPAGPIRNAAMVAAGADRCLAFIAHDSDGATGCARLAERAGIDTRRWTA